MGCYRKRPAGKALWDGILVLAVVLSVLPGPCDADADPGDRLAVCAGIEDDAARLQCFDELAGRGTPARLAAHAEEKSAPQDRADSRETDRLSVMTKQWDLDPEHRRHSFVIRPHRMNYFLPVAHNSSPNEEANLEYDPAARAQHNEAKFQISFKAKIWEDVFQDSLQGVYDRVKAVRGADVWIAYTQLCFWQLYNSAFSSPFRDTNYEPEVLVNLRTDYDLLGFKGRYVQVGLNHQSNGRSRPLSRSWNRVVANVGLERNAFALQLKTWYRLPEDEGRDDNPDILRHMGYGELWASYFWEKQRFSVMLRNNLRRENLGAVQLEWSIPPIAMGRLILGSVISEETLSKYLTDKFSFYVQYFNGYGEGLMDYNKSTNRISAGVMIAEWN
jgi:phospholipase A1